jgi:hypothetical protein
MAVSNFFPHSREGETTGVLLVCPAGGPSLVVWCGGGGALSGTRY